MGGFFQKISNLEWCEIYIIFIGRKRKMQRAMEKIDLKRRKEPELRNNQQF